ncbi:MAG: hypothetical protein GDA65_02410 [Nitrospira sp. CR1.1]|jgi:metal-sulfur cluster biosynthetic enzyme|nr:hypothetical protein [Nitrospira sp. CR1.1]
MLPKSSSNVTLTTLPSLACRLAVLGMVLLLNTVVVFDQWAQAADATADAELQIDITKIGLGKEVVITQGKKEWFMRVEVTPENSVIVRQEKEGARYLLDESETHDRAMTPAEVDAAIADFVNSVKTRQKVK